MITRRLRDKARIDLSEFGKHHGSRHQIDLANPPIAPAKSSHTVNEGDNSGIEMGRSTRRVLAGFYKAAGTGSHPSRSCGATPAPT
jgi:hypothetical protein